MTRKYFEHVGSFLRPEELKTARAKFAAGELSQEELTAIEDSLITELVDKQIEAGLEKVTDGEFRRSWWHLDFFWGLEGIERGTFEEEIIFQGTVIKGDTAYVSGKIGFNPETHPFVDSYRFLKKLTNDRGVEAKLSIPSPGQCFSELFRGSNALKALSIYPNPQDLLSDLVQAYRDAILYFYSLGLRTLQYDDCTWIALMDEEFWKKIASSGIDKDTFRQTNLFANNGPLSDLPNDLIINTHVCRGNFRSSHIAEGPYDQVADSLFKEQKSETYFLEYDDERSGGFEALNKVPENKVAVLGLVTTKTGELEDKAALVARIKEASQHLPLEQLWLSTQCGFASTEEGNILTEADQWVKLKLVKEVIDEVWG